MVETDRKFFCSELIAKAYKCCNILKDSEIHSSTYNPSDFSSARNTLDLVDGVTLSNEMIVITNSMFNKEQEYRRGAGRGQNSKYQANSEANTTTHLECMVFIAPAPAMYCRRNI